MVPHVPLRLIAVPAGLFCTIAPALPMFGIRSTFTIKPVIGGWMASTVINALAHKLLL
jgi:hypothetical protein